MGKWEMVKIPEVVFFQEGPGVRNTQYTNHGVKLINVANLQNGKLDLSTSDRYISENEAYGRYKHFLVDEGDFIIASSGIQVDYFEKKMGFADKSHLPLCMNTSTIRFKSLDDKKLNLRYFMYSLKTPLFKEQLKKLITGSAQLNFGPTHIKKMLIPLPPLEIQGKIIDILDISSAALENRRAQINKLDLLIKSQFIEMFGDPVTNPMGWELVQWDSLFNTTTGKLDSNAMDENGIYPFFTCAKESFWINEYDFDCEALLLAGNNAAGIYDVKYYSGKFNAYQRTYVITLKDIENKYSVFKILLELKLEYLRHSSKGSNTKYLTLGILNSLEFIKPSNALQKQFSEFVQLVEIQKALLQNSLTKLELNHESLMQKCFKGEMFYG